MHVTRRKPKKGAGSIGSIQVNAHSMTQSVQDVVFAQPAIPWSCHFACGYRNDSILIIIIFINIICVFSFVSNVHRKIKSKHRWHSLSDDCDAHIFECPRCTADNHDVLDPLTILGVRECPFACIKQCMRHKKQTQHAAARLHQN